MKKIIGFLSFFLASHLVSAQEVGIRFGDVAGGNDVAVDGVFSSGKFSRIHADISFGNGGVGADALWDFVYKPIDGDNLNWYAGVGPSAFIGDNFLLGASGEVGLEYRFEGAPIALGVDWRPTLWIVENTDFHAGGFGLNVRYVF
ncbi:outer membrane insertion C- signal [Flavobacterium restrictum]|jgi:hypothetical protein|uniref:Outer membrane insertion C-signal n=1 Tax=Flavobacterium restrictum TaxID=2594428 RepID=A0A553E7A4_9FLAO|nr:outer membrane insertion C- signal [Flavobacterium restrictum]TRX40875.1 outer membrane insertion C- signal [Flavobacterium restrictum]